MSDVAAEQGPSEREIEEIVRRERGKWEPSALSGVGELLGMFADDFLSVEYGADFNGAVSRKTMAEIMAGPPLPPERVELGSWEVRPLGRDAVLLSYRVEGISFPWRAYATSVWARRGGEWKTVFYQASTAK